MCRGWSLSLLVNIVGGSWMTVLYWCRCGHDVKSKVDHFNCKILRAYLVRLRQWALRSYVHALSRGPTHQRMRPGMKRKIVSSATCPSKPITLETCHNQWSSQISDSLEWNQQWMAMLKELNKQWEDKKKSSSQAWVGSEPRREQHRSHRPRHNCSRWPIEERNSS